MTLSLSGDIAATITAVGTLVTVVGNLVMQIMQAKRSKENGRKIDENTALTKATAAKVDDVHAVQVASTGSFPALKQPDP